MELSVIHQRHQSINQQVETTATTKSQHTITTAPVTPTHHSNASLKPTVSPPPSHQPNFQEPPPNLPLQTPTPPQQCANTTPTRTPAATPRPSSPPSAPRPLLSSVPALAAKSGRRSRWRPIVPLAVWRMVRPNIAVLQSGAGGGLPGM